MGLQFMPSRRNHVLCELYKEYKLHFRKICFNLDDRIIKNLKKD